MALRPADAVGVSSGQPERIDQHSEGYQQRIGADQLLIQSQPINTPQNLRTDVRRDPATLQSPQSQQPQPQPQKNNAPAWQAHERALANSGQAWQTRKTTAWSQFSNGRGRQEPTSGAVVIDGGRGTARTRNADPRNPTPLPVEDGDTTGWRRVAVAYRGAAQFEEHAEDRLRPFIGAQLPRPPLVRRRFTLKT
jgi:hypothetical protein